MRKVMGHWIQQFTCPKCGDVGAGNPGYLPICRLGHQMLPSHNEVILNNWEEEHRKNIERMKTDPEKT